MRVWLNGWQRLWLVVSVLYLCLVAVVTIMFWPTPETTWHRDEFITRMPVELRAHVDGAYASKREWEEAQKTGSVSVEPFARGYQESLKKGNILPPLTGDIKKDFPAKSPRSSKSIPLPPDFVLESSPVSFPNGAVLQVHVVKEGDTEPDSRVADAYWAVVKSAARAEQWTRAWQMALVWLTPCLALYALGRAAGWVWQGFRSNDSREPKGQ